MPKLRLSVSAVPVIFLACIAILVSVQAGCSGKDEDDCNSFRGGCRQDPDDDDRPFLEKVNPFD